MDSPTITTTATGNLRYVKGIGPRRAIAFERIGIRAIRDLLYYFPRRYEDRSHFFNIEDLTPGQTVTLRGEILDVKMKPLRRISILEVQVGDHSGMIRGVWFNQPYLKSNFKVGEQVILFGKVEWYQDRLQMTSPEYELIDTEEESIHTGRITPIYPLTEGLFQRSLRSSLKDILQNHLEKEITDYLPEVFRQKRNLMPLREAIAEIHFPTSFENLEKARQRIIYDEFFLFELTLLKKAQNLRLKHKAFPLLGGEKVLKEFCDHLPFHLTASQEQACRDLIRDLGTPVPMNRLLQGDVGSGKTAVAAFALLLTALSQHQGVMLIPTEILAEQHFKTISKLLSHFSISIGLLTSSTPDQKRDRLLAQVRQKEISILVGTHALFHEEVQFPSLAMVIIDEQHKFGVHQRCHLLHKDPRPHQLVMTATPIPRTLALTIFGDLETSIMKELPAGRKPIKTYWVTRKKQDDVLSRIHKKVKEENQQAYFIFPLIEETEKLDLTAAKREYENLRKGRFADLKLGLVHGKLDSKERDQVMKDFQQGRVQILFSTSVVEVGVDNPNASLMVIENAERFGLSQLHQLRGRIGRGALASECFLFGEPKTTEGKKRLRIMTKTQDGFLIAEEDLKLRGPGDFWGTRQSGAPLFRLADPIRDEEILLDARTTALELIRFSDFDKNPDWAIMRKHLEDFPLKY